MSIKEKDTTKMIMNELLKREFGAGLGLIFTRVFCRFRCAICLGQTEKEELHYVIEGRFDDLVCWRCGERHAPDLAAVKAAWCNPNQTLTPEDLVVLRKAVTAAGWPQDALDTLLEERCSEGLDRAVRDIQEAFHALGRDEETP